jgi:hypothetical protein
METESLLQAITNWQQFLLHDPLPEQLTEVLPVFLKKRSQTFIETVPHSFADKQNQELNTWFGHQKGKIFCAWLVMCCGSKCLSMHKKHNQPTMQGMRCTKYPLLHWLTSTQSK